MPCGDCEDCSVDKIETVQFCNHEIHVTVHQDLLLDQEKFVRDCRSISVDPVVMSFRGPLSGTDFMTRESFHGPDAGARRALVDTAEKLRRLGYDPIRVKIESAPWHPLAPLTARDTRPIGSYYESHMGLWLHEAEVPAVLRAAHPLSVLVSLNERREPRADGRRRYSVTLRSGQAGRTEQEAAASLLRDSFRARGIDADSKVRTEWSWLDLAFDPRMPGGPLPAQTS